VRKVWLTVLTAGATALVSLGLPAGAVAGTFTWSLPADFTATAPGANPDHDAYGATPWSYRESAPAPLLGSPSHGPSGLKKLPGFTTGIDGGLAGWMDSGDPGALIATNPTGSPISNGGATFPAGMLAATPPSDRLVAIGWTSPLPGSTKVTVTGSVVPDGQGCVVGGYTWSLDQNGNALQQGSGASSSVSATATVPSGGSIYLAVAPSLIYPGAACATAGVSLQIRADVSAGPQVTLTSPANGALINRATPTFSGAASTAFGAGKQITVQIYSGASASGTPVQTLFTNASGGRYSASLSGPLDDGVYTAQAAQQDLASPPDTGSSAPSSFRINNATPQIKLSSPSSEPQRSATPTLTGVAGTAKGDANSVKLIVYPGGDTTGAPARYLSGSVDGRGDFSVRVTPGLDDGQYTAVAAQGGPASSVGFSSPVTFRVKLHPPTVTLTSPAAGSNTSRRSPVFSGVAGDTVDDSATVTVTLYSGASTKAKALGTMSASRSGASWSGAWPRALKLGLYTAVASQRDDAGHTGRTSPNTFLIVPSPAVIGTGVSVSQGGLIAVPLMCSAPPGQTCTGEVLVTTVRSFRPVPGGPVGHLSVMFAYVTIPGGQTIIVRQQMQSAVRNTLRHAGLARVTVTSLLSAGGKRASTSTVTRLLKVGAINAGQGSVGARSRPAGR
jgi:hypothetical protein